MTFVNMTTEHSRGQIMWCWRVIQNQIMDASGLYELNKFITIISTEKHIKDYIM